MAKRKSFGFGQSTRIEDEQARLEDLEALIAPRQTVVQNLPIARIRPNPYQPRRRFEDLEDLAASITAQGFISRLRVRPDSSQDGYFQLVYGERRLRAAAIAGLENVPCEISDHSDEEMIEIGLAENIQRRDLDPLEEADAFRTLTEEMGYSIRGLAEKIGKDKSYIENRLALLKAPEDVREMVARRPDTLRAAREISHLENPEERQILINGVLSREITTEGIRERLRHSPGKLPEGEYRVVISIIRKWQTTAGQDQVIDGELLGYVRQLQNDLTRLEEQLSRVNGEI